MKKLNFTPNQRKKILEAATKTSPKAAAAKFGISIGRIYAWRSRKGDVLNHLPTTAVKVTKPRALKPITYACPHCQGPVTVPA